MISSRSRRDRSPRSTRQSHSSRRAARAAALLALAIALGGLDPGRAGAQSASGAPKAAAQVGEPAAPAERSGLQQWGVKLGYGTSKQGQVEVMPVYGQLGWSLPDVVDQPLRRFHIDVNWIVEGWAAGIHTPRSDAFEFGINPIEFKIAYDAGQQFVPFFQGGVGVMYTSLQDGLSLGGPFEFDEVVGGGLELFCTKSFALTVEYRYRHMSNAGLSDDNSGLDTSYVLFGITEHPQR